MILDINTDAPDVLSNPQLDQRQELHVDLHQNITETKLKKHMNVTK